MSVAFIVEDGTGTLASTSYVDVATATDYYSTDPVFSATWAGMTATTTNGLTQQQNLLIAATRIMDQRGEWNGELAYPGTQSTDPTTGAVTTTGAQALRWPRQYVYDRDGNLLSSAALPKQLVQATCEVGKYILSNDLTTSQDVTHYQAIRVDVIDIVYQPNTWQMTFPPHINIMLAGLGRLRVGGSSFGRIVKA